MCAIRESKDPQRTLDAFWRGQMQSKEWLVKTLECVIWPERNKTLNFPLSVDIHGGWVGTLASLLFQSDIPVSYIRSIDIDSECESIATMMNKLEEMAGRFSAVTADMCLIESSADLIINTSCEHISQGQYDLWLSNLPDTSLIVLQSNDYNIPEHIRPANSLEHFIEQSHIKVEHQAELELPLYKRFMIMGRK
jgi:hypothetical protein